MLLLMKIIDIVMSLLVGGLVAILILIAIGLICMENERRK